MSHKLEHRLLSQKWICLDVVLGLWFLKVRNLVDLLTIWQSQKLGRACFYAHEDNLNEAKRLSHSNKIRPARECWSEIGAQIRRQNSESKLQLSTTPMQIDSLSLSLSLSLSRLVCAISLIEASDSKPGEAQKLPKKLFSFGFLVILTKKAVLYRTNAFQSTRK